MPGIVDRRFVLAALVVVFVAATSFGGVFDPANDWLTATRARVLPQPAAGDAVIVAVDTASLQSDRAWPWSREKHATLVRTLDDAGARAIAFDFDFSSLNDGDAAFADAIAASDASVHVAVFRREYEGLPGVFAEVLPNQTIAPHVTANSTAFLVSEDGLVRAYQDGTHYSFGLVPSLAFSLADRRAKGEDALLSLARSPSQVPVYSFVDVVDGRVDPAAFEGKTVIVGATAAELGDEFAMPAYGLQSGVLLNALAYEAAKDGDFPRPAPWPLVWILTLLPASAVLIGWPKTHRQLPRYVAQNTAAVIIVASIALGAQFVGQTILPTMQIYAAHGLLLLGVGVLSIDEFAARDYRNRMALKTTASFMEALINSNHDGVLILDRHGKIVRTNDAVTQLTTKSDTDIVGQTLADALPCLVHLPLDLPTGSDQVAFTSGAVVDVHWSKIETARGSNPYERRQTERVSTLIILHDVTQLIEAERTERRARIEHEEASAAKSALVMTMSHELRTPLNAVIGFSDLIRDEAFGAHTSPQYAEFADMAATGGRQLLGIVDDLLQVAEFQAGRAEPERQRAQVGDMVANATATLSDRPGGFALTPSVEGADIVGHVDTDMVELALRHLLSNVEKFAGTDATVKIAISIVDDDLRIAVGDDGPGLAPGVAAEGLTELFQQADGSLTRSGEGCGLGLFLVQSVAAAHGGTVLIDGEDGFEAMLVFPGGATPAPSADVAAKTAEAA